MDKIILTTREELQSLIHDTVQQLLDEAAGKLNEPRDEILNIAQASKLLNLAKQTIYGLTSQNKLPFFKRGKKLYFRRSELTQMDIRRQKEKRYRN